MQVWSTVAAYALAGLFLGAGVTHFTHQRFYARMMPLWLGGHRLWVAVTGLLEIAAAVLLIVAPTRVLGAWLAVGMLTAFLLVHVNMFFDAEAAMGLPRWALWLRLGAQFALIAVALVAAGLFT